MAGIAARRRLALPLGVGAAALALSACGGGGGASTSSALPQGCEAVQRPPAKHVDLKPPAKRVRPGEKLTAAIETSCGTFDVSLDTAQSPKTVGSFVYLADKGVYDDTTFHRVVPNFVIQGGDPLGTGTGGPGYSVDEPPPPRTEYTKGTVAMAKTAVEPAGRSGSQFFVVTATDAGLPPQYALLGKVSSGQNVVNRIASLGSPGSGEAGAPAATVLIRKVEIERG
jgi:peptidyl-prolyl cis-trans isomerase B (cyclophilin B)